MNEREPRGGNGRHEGPFEQRRARRLLDPTQIITGLVLMIPVALITAVVSYFAATYELKANTLELQRHDARISALQQADRDRAVRDAETVARMEAVIQRMDELLKRIERIEDKR
jgi:hypothetical protein